MNTKTKILIVVAAVFLIILTSAVLVWKKQRKPIQLQNITTTSEISKEKALKLANQAIEEECETTFPDVEKTTWNIQGPGFENLKNICPKISEYKENKIWKGEKSSGENIEIIGLVGIYGKFVCAYALNKKTGPGIMPLSKGCAQKKEVTIATDKAEYKQGETVKITVKNNLPVPIWYVKSLDGCRLSFWQLEKFNGTDWENVEYTPRILCEVLRPEKKKLNPNETIRDEWSGITFDTNHPDGTLASPGKYRIKFYHSMKNLTGKNLWNFRKQPSVYSEFTIKPIFPEPYSSTTIPADFLSCRVNEDCISGEKCGQVCYSRNYEKWYNENIGLCAYKKTNVSCKCEESRCQIEEIQKPNYSISDNTLLVDIRDSYIPACLWKPSIYIFENGSWRKVNRYLPGKGMYYLDNNLKGYGLCDVPVCQKIENLLEIKLVEYKRIGEREVEYLGRNYTVPVYQSVKLKGKVKVEFEYFSDKECKNKIIYSDVFKLQ